MESGRPSTPTTRQPGAEAVSWGRQSCLPPAFSGRGRAALAWQAEECPTHAAQPPGNGQSPAVGFQPARAERRKSRLERLLQAGLAAPHVYFALSRLANRRYAPGTPAGSCRNHEYALKM